MRWKGRRRSRNIEDRRGRPRRMGLPFPGRLPGLGGRRGRGGILGLVVTLGLMYFLGVDPRILLQGGGLPGAAGGGGSYQPDAAENELAAFVSVVLADTEDTWHALFRQRGARYQEPRLVLFSGAVQSACGLGQAAMGPFYCPGDRKVYIDLGFYRELRERHGAPGDFAQAYVIAHEIGHHVQNLMGTSTRVQAARRRLSKAQGNRLSVRLELQADCYAGLWAHHANRTRQILEEGDLEEALRAASAIGDDRLQRQATGYVNPDAFTHGSSEQRVRWFRQGFESGRIEDCDTFDPAKL